MKNIFRKIIQKFSLMNFTTFITFFPPLYIKNFKGKSLYIKTGWRREYFGNKTEKIFGAK